ncbi:MAG: type I restriction endonuclease subunit R, EcoR124 family, partial [Marmoricola sp.]
MDAEGLDGSSRDFLEKAIVDYNATFGTSYDTSSAKFENYYKDLAKRVKDRDVDLVLVVNMFLTGFDATTLNTLWVDKNLRSHGLIQAFSRTNRILNSVKAYGNIVCFRNLESAVDDALALFGNSEARGVVLLKPYAHYRDAYAKTLDELMESTPPGEEPFGEATEKRFVVLFGELLRLRNVLTSFDEFAHDDPLSPRQLQDYTSVYNGLWEKHRKSERKEKESILDDVVFEIELVKQVEVNIDYILMLVAKWREAKAAGTEHVSQVVDIETAVEASPTLRNKRDLIMDFVEAQSVSADVGEDWRRFVAARREAELDDLITRERLRAPETKAFVADAFQDGAVPTTGTAITQILPPASRFSADNDHGAKKHRVLARLQEFFDRYFGLVRDPDGG